MNSIGKKFMDGKEPFIATRTVRVKEPSVGRRWANGKKNREEIAMEIFRS